MDTFEDITAARNGIMDFRTDYGSEIPAHLKARFRELSASPSPVDQIVGTGEFIWANRNQLTKPAWNLGAGLIAFATTNAWHGLLEDGRGDAIVANLRKDMGEIKTAPAAPEPKMGYRIDPEAETPAPAPPPPATSTSDE